MHKYPDDFINKIICGDCLEVMKDIPDESIDLVVTSPPYNKKGFRNGKNTAGKSWRACNVTYISYDDNMKESDYANWQVNVLNECYRVIKPSGSIFYNHKVRRYHNKASFPEFALNSNAKLYQLITWERSGAYDKNIQYLYPNSELIFWLVKDKPKTYKRSAILKSEIWKIAQKSNKQHPAPFPEELPTNCILLSTEKNDVVLDPFMGIGTTILASRKLERNYIGIDIDENYLRIAEVYINEKK